MTTLMRLTASFILVAQAVTATTIARAGEDKAAASVAINPWQFWFD